jgi:hypothetical protein
MNKRRDFLKKTALMTGGFILGTSNLSRSENYNTKRPPKSQRNFTSPVVEETISEIKAAIKDPELAWMFENCFPNTLDTTVNFSIKNGYPDTFVITGDINAMWLRDSSAQVYHYLPFVNQDSRLKQLIAGVIKRQTKCILIDPYANAFNLHPIGSHWENDLTDMKPELHERKWEIDSLCYPIRLAYSYWKKTGDKSIFDEEWQKAMNLVLNTFFEQQRKDGRGSYQFQRKTANATDTLPLHGWGRPTKKIGLIHSMFRPSDDATIYPFLIPSNLFAISSLQQLAQMTQKIHSDSSFAQKCSELADDIEEAIKKYAIIEHLNYGKIYAYEIDGFGNRIFIDDANIPSLLSLPYLDICNENDPIYRNTRSFILSNNNPYYFKGKHAQGIGSPHVAIDMIWPMSIIMQGLTSSNNQEIISCLQMLKDTHACTGFMHESFHKNNPSNYTRDWFAWANSLFGELIYRIYVHNPDLLQQI